MVPAQSSIAVGGVTVTEHSPVTSAIFETIGIGNVSSITVTFAVQELDAPAGLRSIHEAAVPFHRPA
jgi:hypothetical protein